MSSYILQAPGGNSNVPFAVSFPELLPVSDAEGDCQVLFKEEMGERNRIPRSQRRTVDSILDVVIPKNQDARSIV